MRQRLNLNRRINKIEVVQQKDKTAQLAIIIAIFSIIIPAFFSYYSLSETKKQSQATLEQLKLAKEQFDFSKRQSDSAAKEAIKQRRIEREQFNKQLNEWKRQADASIKQTDYQIKAQRPYFYPTQVGYINIKQPDKSTQDSFVLRIGLQNKGNRPAKVISATTFEIEVEKQIINHVIKSKQNWTIPSNSEVWIHPNLRITNLSEVSMKYYYTKVDYMDVITSDKFSESYYFTWRGIKDGVSTYSEINGAKILTFDVSSQVDIELINKIIDKQ